MSRLALVETSDQLPGLLPVQAWSTLTASETIILGSADHPFLSQLETAGLSHEVVPAQAQGTGTEGPAAAGASTATGQAARIVARAEELGLVSYLQDRSDDEALARTLRTEAAGSGVEVQVVPFAPHPKGASVLDLVATEERLLAPGGCPWDREQTHASLIRYAVEEVYELADAVEAGDAAEIREELGDVLLQVVFHAEMADRAGTFDIDDVAQSIVGKLVRRHPHVFGDVVARDADTVMANWEELKQAEKPERERLFDGVPAALPALGYVGKLQSRAAKAGFDWEADADAGERIRSELEELEAAGSQDERAAEVGDLLMSVVGLARRYDVDPETALRGAANRFRGRVDAMVAAAGKPLSELTRDEWLALWEQAKAEER